MYEIPNLKSSFSLLAPHCIKYSTVTTTTYGHERCIYHLCLLEESRTHAAVVRHPSFPAQLQTVPFPAHRFKNSPPDGISRRLFKRSGQVESTVRQRADVKVVMPTVPYSTVRHSTHAAAGIFLCFFRHSSIRSITQSPVLPC
jgi:hypothetical protein